MGPFVQTPCLHVGDLSQVPTLERGGFINAQVSVIQRGLPASVHSMAGRAPLGSLGSSEHVVAGLFGP